MKRVKNNQELDSLIEDWTINRSAEDVMSEMQAAGVPAGLVANAKDMLENPQFKHYCFFNELDHPETGKHAFYPSPPFRLSDATAEAAPPPILGGDNEYVCRKILNMSEIEYEQLVEEKILN